MIIDDDNVNYYEDDDEYFFEKRMKVPKTTIIADAGKKLSPDEEKLKRKLEHETNTINYERIEDCLITPEEATEIEIARRQKESIEEVKDYANPVFAQAVKQVESKLGRKINYDEFDKMCKTYAAELANADARTRNRDPNPIDYNTYYNQLIQNRKVTPAYKVYANKLEEDKVNEISELLQAAKSSGDNSTLKLKVGSSVNMHHKGKVTFEDPSHRRRITIDNKRDVDLLHMKHRKEFLDKKYATQIKEEIGELTHGVHDNEGFE